MKTIEKHMKEIGVAMLLFIALLALCYCLFANTRTEDERQLDEIVNYHRSQGREIIVFE